MGAHRKYKPVQIGDPFGRLTAISDQRRVRLKDRWRLVCDCVCQCGEVREGVHVDVLHGGSTISCGCYHRDRTSEIKGKHRQTGTRLYKIWSGMRNRCLNRKSPFYSCYGGRGISICREWQDSFVPFQAWAITNGYANHLSIERKNVDEGYSPENCTWIPRRDQAKNLRKSVWITAFGERKILADWLRDPRCHVSEGTIRRRMNRGVEGPELFVRDKMKPVRHVGKIAVAFGETKTVGDWSRDPRCLVTSNCLKNRLRRGLSLEQAMTEPHVTWKSRFAS